MKQTEINRLKEICEKEGFTINEINNGISQFFQIEKKDEWEGVEFAEYIGERSNYFTTGKIYLLNTLEEDTLYIKFDDEGDSHEEYTEFFKPSTEQAYKGKGKWAKKITKPEIKVEYTGWEYQGRLDSAVNIGFKVPNDFVMSIRLGELMAGFIKTHIENEKTC